MARRVRYCFKPAFPRRPGCSQRLPLNKRAHGTCRSRGFSNKSCDNIRTATFLPPSVEGRFAPTTHGICFLLFEDQKCFSQLSSTILCRLERKTFQPAKPGRSPSVCATLVLLSKLRHAQLEMLFFLPMLQYLTTPPQTTTFAATEDKNTLSTDCHQEKNKKCCLRLPLLPVDYSCMRVHHPTEMYFHARAQSRGALRDGYPSGSWLFRLCDEWRERLRTFCVNSHNCRHAAELEDRLKRSDTYDRDRYGDVVVARRRQTNRRKNT